MLVSWKLLWDYFDIPLGYYSVKFYNISYFTNGVTALRSKLKIIGAIKHWYSTEQILMYGGYNKLIVEKGLIDRVDGNIVDNIREINKRICHHYFKPTAIYRKIIELNFMNRYHMLINSKYYLVHLRIVLISEHC